MKQLKSVMLSLNKTKINDEGMEELFENIACLFKNNEEFELNCNNDGC